MIHPPTGAKRKIRVKYKRGKMAPERKKSQTKFGISPFLVSPKCCLPTTSTRCQMFQMFSLFLPSAQLQIPERQGRGEGGVGINAIQMCLSPLAWIKDFFQVWCISYRLNLCVLTNATWQSGQGCSFAVLFMSNPSFCSLMLSLTDVFSGSQHTENTWQTEAPGLLGQIRANGFGETTSQSPRRPRDATGGDGVR